MIPAWWLVFRTSPLRWSVPLGSCLCMVLVANNVRGRPETSMQASSEAALAILIWAPAMLLLVYASVRSSALSRDDALVLPLDPVSRLRRSLSVLGAQLAWVMLGWVGFWAGCGSLAGRSSTPLYWSMCLNGVAVVTLTSLAAALIAIHRKPAWMAALASAVAYVGLAIWGYVPAVPESVLYSPYGPLFFTDALPSQHLLELKLVWALAAAAVLTGWLARLLGSLSALSLLLVSAVATTMIATTMPSVVARSDAMQLTCAPHGGVQICLWADHEQQRARMTAEVDLARALLGPAWRAEFVSEGDLDTGLPAALPDGAIRANTVSIPVTANPVPRAAAARIVAAALRPPAACPVLATDGGFGDTVGAYVERLVVSRQETPSAEPLSERQLVARIRELRVEIADCQSPDLP